MDILSKRIYNMFEKYKISINEIESANNTKEILSIIKKYKLLGGIYDFIKLHINKKIESTKLNLFLLSSSFYMVNER